MTIRALITGGSGQDGWYLARLLNDQGYVVHAQSRSPVEFLSHYEEVHWHIGDLSDSKFVESMIAQVSPDEIYNLAAISRPALSWGMPMETARLNAFFPQLLCDQILRNCPSCRLFQASSSEMFGDNSALENESTRFEPKSPYGIAKLYAHRIIGVYREQYGLHVSSGIMFNHESPRRPLAFVSQKIAHAAAALSLGLRYTREVDERGQPILNNGKLYLGDLTVRRDFGFAGDYVKAMNLMVRSDDADDYVIGTGKNHSIAELCDMAFRTIGRDWKDFIVVDPALKRKSDIHHTHADVSKFFRKFGWRPDTKFEDLVAMMVHERIAGLKASFRP